MLQLVYLFLSEQSFFTGIKRVLRHLSNDNLIAIDPGYREDNTGGKNEKMQDFCIEFIEEVNGPIKYLLRQLKSIKYFSQTYLDIQTPFRTFCNIHWPWRPRPALFVWKSIIYLLCYHNGNLIMTIWNYVMLLWLSMNNHALFE